MNGEFARDHSNPSRTPEAEPPPEKWLPAHSRGAAQLRTVVYFLGLVIVLAALAWAALLLGVPEPWIGVGVLFGLGIILIKGTRFTPSPRP